MIIDLQIDIKFLISEFSTNLDNMKLF